MGQTFNFGEGFLCARTVCVGFGGILCYGFKFEIFQNVTISKSAIFLQVP